VADGKGFVNPVPSLYSKTRQSGFVPCAAKAAVPLVISFLKPALGTAKRIKVSK